MTRAEKLKWLAQELKEWKGRYEFCVVNVGHEEVYVTWPLNCSPSPSTFTKAEWRAAREELIKTTEPDSSCHGRGELPPVGCECEVMHDENFVRCEIIAHFKQKASMVAAYTVDSNGCKQLGSCIAEYFRPLRTEREKVIDAACEVVGDVIGGRLIIERLYDAGLLK